MAPKIEEIEGIGRSHANRLAKAQIDSTADLLRLCAGAKGRQQVSQRTGIRASTLLKWANMADLMRISGVGQEYSELLEAAGVDTIKELAARRAADLAARMKAVNAQRKLTRRTPGAARVEGWIEQARALQPLISH